MQVSSGPKYNATVVLDLAADTKPWHYGGLNDPAGTCSPVGFVAGSRELVLRAYRNRETWICVIDPGAQKLVREWKLPAMP